MSLAEKYRELEEDRKRMDFMLRNPDEAACAVSDAYNQWGGDNRTQWQNLLRAEIDFQIAKSEQCIICGGEDSDHKSGCEDGSEIL